MERRLNRIRPADQLTKLEYTAIALFDERYRYLDEGKEAMKTAVKEAIEAAVILLDELEDFQGKP